MSELLKELLDRMSFIDQQDKDIVNGYLREMEHQFEIIPSIIFHLVLAFFCKPNEYFAKSGKNVKLSNNNQTVMKVGVFDWDNTTYGHQWIPSMEQIVVRWKFMINSNPMLGTGMSFGIISRDRRCNENSINTIDSPSYIYNIFGTQNQNGVTINQNSTFSCRCKAGDVIIIELDLIKKKVSVIDKPKGGDIRTNVLFENVETGQSIKYKIGVMMIKSGTKITLNELSFRSQ